LPAPAHEEIAFENLNFKTPSGKIELVSQEAEKRWNVDPLPIYLEPKEFIEGDKSLSKKYSLYFMTPNTKNRIHSQFNNLKMISQFSEKPFIYINPKDAQQRRIKEGDTVRIFNNRGELKLETRFDYGLKEGCLSVSNGWWIEEGGTVNFCSNGRETDMGYGAAFHDNLVEIEKVS